MHARAWLLETVTAAKEKPCKLLLGGACRGSPFFTVQAEGPRPVRRLKEAPCKSGNLAPQVADIFPLAYLFIFELSFCSRRFFDVYLRPTPYHKFLKLQPSVKAPRLSWRKVLFVFEFLSVSDCTFLPKTKMGEGGLSCSCSSASPSPPSALSLK